MRVVPVQPVLQSGPAGQIGDRQHSAIVGYQQRQSLAQPWRYGEVLQQVFDAMAVFTSGQLDALAAATGHDPAGFR